jgi:hypothetical protein
MTSDTVKRNGVGGTADADRYLADLRRTAKAKRLRMTAFFHARAGARYVSDPREIDRSLSIVNRSGFAGGDFV